MSLLWGPVPPAVEQAEDLACPACHEGTMLPSFFGGFCNKCNHCDYSRQHASGTCPCAYCNDRAASAA